jgi:hypothetical protein
MRGPWFSGAAARRGNRAPGFASRRAQRHSIHAPTQNAASGAERLRAGADELASDFRRTPADDATLQPKGAVMRKCLLAFVAIAGLAGSACAVNAFAAPGDAPTAPNAAAMERLQERHALMLDAHLAAMKAGLKLSDDQAKTWPAFETAIRDAEKARADRWRQAQDRMGQGERPTPIERMTMMSDHLQKMGENLKMVADAAKPLYDSLTDAQKRDFGPLMREFKLHGRR